MVETKINRAPMLVAATITLSFLGVLYAWSIFRVELNKIFPDWSISQLSMNFTIAMACFCMGSFMGGKLSSRFSPRLSSRVAAALVFTGYMGVSFIGKLESGSALTMLYIFYGVFAGTGSGMGNNSCMGSVPLWFPKHLGLVSGVLFMGFGFGNLVLGMFVEKLSGIMGVFNVFRLYAVLLSVALIMVSFFVKRPPLAEAAKKVESGDGVSLRPSQMIKKAPFWLFFFWNMILASSCLLVVNSAASISLYFGAAAWLGLLVTIISGLGSIFAGAIMDKLGKLWGMFIMNGLLVFAGVLLIATIFSESIITMIIGMLSIGVVYGGGAAINAKVINDLFGSAYYTVNYTVSNLSLIPASFIGPYITGVLQDRSGNYTSTFIMLLSAAVLDVFLNLMLRHRLKKEGKEA